MTTIASVGSYGPFGPNGRPATIVAMHKLGQPKDGQQLVALRIRPDAVNGPKDVAKDPAVRPLTRSDGPPLPLQPVEDQGPRVAPGAARSAAELSPGEKAEVTRLRQRDQQVRQEEEAHAAVAGNLSGPIQYVYQTGPDGRAYAVGGSVPIRTSAVGGGPEQIARAGAKLAAAAHAATNPSAADLRVAREAYRLAAQGQQDTQAKRSRDILV